MSMFTETDAGLTSTTKNTMNSASIKSSGKMSATALCLTVLAFSAPIAVVEGFIPLTIAFGGPGAATAFLITSVLLVLFAIGYVTINKYVEKPGNFYTFISMGLGRPAGLGSAFLAVFSYLALLGGTYVFLGVSTSSLVASMGGPETPWTIWAVLGWALVSTLGHFHIEFSAKVLTWAMIIEIIIVMIFNVAVLMQGGAEGLTLEPFTPGAFMQGDIAVMMLFTVLVFLGFEATALFRDDVKNPDKSVPRATYGAVIFIGALYSLTCYALVIAYGESAWETASANPTTMFANSIGVFVAPIFKQITYASVVLSIIAALISIHNVLSRYVLNLARDKALPEILSAVHISHGSPYLASFSVAFSVAAAIIPVFLSSSDGPSLYAIAIGLGGLGVIFLMGFASLAIPAWFVKTKATHKEHKWKILIAPTIAGLSLLSTAIYAASHIDLVVGGKPGEFTWLILWFLAIFMGGALRAVHFKRSKPEVYVKLGQTQ